MHAHVPNVHVHCHGLWRIRRLRPNASVYRQIVLRFAKNTASSALATDCDCENGLSKSTSVRTRKMVKLCLKKAKVAETLVEARRDIEVQIARCISEEEPLRGFTQVSWSSTILSGEANDLRSRERVCSFLANDRSLGNLIVGQPMERNMERQTQGQERANRLRKTNSEAQKLTMTGIQPVQVYGHTAQGTSTAQVNAMCKNLKMGWAVMGKTRAKSASGSQCGEVSMPTQGAEFVRSGGKKAPTLAKDPRRWNQTTGPISATICSVLEAGLKPSTPGFWQAPDASASLDGALFNKAQIWLLQMQTWKSVAGHSLSTGMEKGIIADFANKARFQLIKEGNLMAAPALDFLVCGAIKRTSSPCG